METSDDKPVAPYDGDTERVGNKAVTFGSNKPSTVWLRRFSIIVVVIYI